MQFDMFAEEYQQIREVVEHSECLEEVIERAHREEGEGLKAIVEGWLETGFKEVVRGSLERLESGKDSDV